jgi:hypothetical protein
MCVQAARVSEQRSTDVARESSASVPSETFKTDLGEQRRVVEAKGILGRQAGRPIDRCPLGSIYSDFFPPWWDGGFA